MIGSAILIQWQPFFRGIVLALHLLWALWMISGIMLAISGFFWKRLWAWKTFRVTHLLGLIGTATVPIWGKGICPLTRLEWMLKSSSGGAPDSFMVRMLHDLLYIDIDPVVLSLITGGLALVTVIIFIMHPPWSIKIRA